MVRKKTTYQVRKDRASRRTIAAALARLAPRYQGKHDVWPFLACLGATDRAYRIQYRVAATRLAVLKRSVLAQPRHNVLVTSTADMPDPRVLTGLHIQELQRLWPMRVYLMETPEQADALLRRLRMVGRLHDFGRGDAQLLMAPYELRSHNKQIRVYPASELTEARNELEHVIMTDNTLTVAERILAINYIERRIGAYHGLPDWPNENAHRKEIRDFFCLRTSHKGLPYIHFATYRH